MKSAIEQSIKEKIKALAKERETTFAELWMTLILERFLTRLVRSPYNESNNTAIALLNSQDPHQIITFENAKFWHEITFEALAFAVGKTINDFVAPPGKKKTYFDDKFVDSVLEQAAQLIKRLD